MNNPALCGYAEAREIFKKSDDKTKNVTASDMKILSLSTGSSPKPYYYKDVKNWGLVQWVKPLIDIMMSGVSDTVDYQLAQIYDAVEKPEQYLRITPRSMGTANSAMDDGSVENVNALKEVGIQTAMDFNKQLEDWLLL